MSKARSAVHRFGPENLSQSPLRETSKEPTTLPTKKHHSLTKNPRELALQILKLIKSYPVFTGPAPYYPKEASTFSTSYSSTTSW